MKQLELIQNLESLESKAASYIAASGEDEKSFKTWRESYEFEVIPVKASKESWSEALSKVCEDCEGAEKADENDGIRVAGFASTFKNVDRENDIVLPVAFDKTVAELQAIGKLPMLKDHNNSVDSQVGSFTKFKITAKGLFVEGTISRTKETEHMIKLIEEGHLNTFSMGGLFKFADGGSIDSRGRRFIEEVALLETSIVSIPANPKAVFNRKSSDSQEKPKEVEKSKPEGLSHREKVIKTIEIIRGAELCH